MSVVIGSFNIDIVTSVEKFPVVGETVRCNKLDIFVGGGKGRNQAVALGKLGGNVMMVGKLGDKFYGPEYLKVLEQNNVKCEAVGMIENAFPGFAFVSVDKNRDNVLFIHPGTNACVDRDHIEKHWKSISSCDIFLFQLEIPLNTNIYTMEKLRELGKTIIFDPAPVMEFPEKVYSCIDYITPNEIELQQLTGIDVSDENSYKRAALELIRRGAKAVIAKAGKRGAYLVTEKEFTHICTFPVKAIDPTAAGDSFNAGFAYSLACGKGVHESIRFANATAGLSTTAMGAQNAMPSLEQVEKLLEKHA